MESPSLSVCGSVDALAIKVAGFVLDCAREAVRERGRFLLALSGGTTPEPTYAQLASRERGTGIAWSKTFIFFGDERFVPHSDIRSNYAMTRRCFLNEVPIPASQVFPVQTHVASVSEAAASYIAQLAAFFHLSPESSPPVFDLILLGLGDDGHTASLFPGSPALHSDAWVAATKPGTTPPFVDRITFTFPMINAARRVAFIVAGEKKAEVLHRILDDAPDPNVYPAAGVRPVQGLLSWFVDTAAAKQLTRRPTK